VSSSNRKVPVASRCGCGLWIQPTQTEPDRQSLTLAPPGAARCSVEYDQIAAREPKVSSPWEKPSTSSAVRYRHRLR